VGPLAQEHCRGLRQASGDHPGSLQRREDGPTQVAPRGIGHHGEDARQRQVWGKKRAALVAQRAIIAAEWRSTLTPMAVLAQSFGKKCPLSACIADAILLGEGDRT
jgi:hypothetical protein